MVNASTSLLKIISFSSIGYKRQLLLSSNEVLQLSAILEQQIKVGVILLNTNLGLDVYYLSEADHSHAIVESFLTLVTPRGKAIKDFHVHILLTSVKIKTETELLFMKFTEAPLLFKGYSKSVFRQLEVHYQHHPEIINALFRNWQDALKTVLTFESHSNQLPDFLKNLQNAYVDNSCEESLRSLLKEAIHSNHYN